MAAKNVRRPGSLIAQNQESLRTNQAANRRRLRESGLLASPGGQRPPQLPTGYPRTEGGPSLERPSTGSRDAPASPRDHPSSSGRLVRLPSVEGSQSSQRSPRRQHSTGGCSPSASSPSVGSPAGSPASSAGFRKEEEPEDDDDFASMLTELDELTQHLASRGEPLRGHSQATSSADARPATGGTSASESTTVPTSSLAATDSTAPADWEDGAEDVRAPIAEDALSTLRGAHLAHHEISRLRLPHGCKLETSQGSFAQFFLTMDVAEGPYTPASLTFWVKIFAEYPAPGSFSIRCTKRVFHPNIDAASGAVQIQGILDESTEVRISSLVSGVVQLVRHPTDSPAVNADAAMLLQTDPDEFRRTVRLALNGGDYRGVKYDRVLSIPGKATSAPLAGKQLSMSEQTRIDLMKLEVLKEEFKAQVGAYHQVNIDELKTLN